MVFAECSKVYELDFWNSDVQISDTQNELKNHDVNALCSEWKGEGKSPLHGAALLVTKAHVEF